MNVSPLHPALYTALLFFPDQTQPIGSGDPPDRVKDDHQNRGHAPQFQAQIPLIGLVGEQNEQLQRCWAQAENHSPLEW